MSDKIEYSRLLVKRSNIGGEVPTIPPLSAVTLNQFTPTDLFVGEFFANVQDDRLWIRTNTGLLELNTSGATGTTSTLTQVLNAGNNTGGFDIVVSSGNTIVYSGLSTGSTSQYLGLDVNGRTIITAASGGSGTSGTSGAAGTNGSSGINGTSGSSGVNGTSGTSATGGTPNLQSVLAVGNTTGANNIIFPSGRLIQGDLGYGSFYPQASDNSIAMSYVNTGATVSGGINISDAQLSVSYTNGTQSSSIQSDGNIIEMGNAGGVFQAINTGATSGLTIDIAVGSKLYINNLTSGITDTFLVIDPDTKRVTYQTGGGGSGTSGTSGSSGRNGTSGSSGVNGTSGTSGTGGGGGTGPLGCTHFAYPLATGQTYSLSLTSTYQEMTMSTDFANRILAWPFVPGRNLSVKGLNIDFFSLNGNTAGRMKYLIYDNDDGNFLPKNLIYESSTITPAGFTVVQYSQDITLSAGTTYWLATAFNTGMTPTYNMRANQVTGVLTIGPPNEADGHGKMYKMAVSDTISFPTIPSTWTKIPGPVNFYGSVIMYNGYWGGTNTMPEIRIKT